MEVTVKLYSTFSKYNENLENGKSSLEAGSTICDLAKQIGLPLKYVRLIFLNGVQCSLETRLAHNDLVSFLPPAIGGG